MKFKSIDIFCHVVDNFGDIGVVYRFAKEFKRENPLCKMRIFIDALGPLAKIDPQIDASGSLQELDGLVYVDSSKLDKNMVEQLGAPDVLIEAFGCAIPEAVMEKARTRTALWINLEYLSAEAWVEGYHRKESLRDGGTMKKYFYMPGFSANTGGVVIDSRVERNKPYLQSNRLWHLNNLLDDFGVRIASEEHCLAGSVFTYLRGFDALITDIEALGREAYLLVCGEKSQEGMRSSMGRLGGRQVDDRHFIHNSTHALFMPFLPQPHYDALLCLTDFNLVRGEDSLVRAILAERPFLWNAYLQDNRYQIVKADAFLSAFQPYFDDPEVFRDYRNTTMAFNDMAAEAPLQGPSEKFAGFFQHLDQIGRAAGQMARFLVKECDLVQKFTDFLLQS